MKTLEEFILEKLKINKIETNYKPKNKEELVNIIIDEIEANGPDCSLNHIDVSNITDMSYLFVGGDNKQNPIEHPVLSEFDGDISGWNVSNVTNMRYMFVGCKYSGKDGDISNWDVSNVTDMTGMFEYSNYNGDLSKWDVSNVTNMSYLFCKCDFDGTNGDISNWDVSKVTDMSGMFMNNSYNGDISNWKINQNTEPSMYGIFNNSPLRKNPPAWYNKYSKDNI